MGQLVSMLGNQMSEVAIPIQVYLITQSTFYTGLVSGLSCAVLLLSSLVGGLLADKYNKKNLLIRCEFALLFIPMLLCVNACQETPSLTLLFWIAPLNAFLIGIHRPSVEALAPKLVASYKIPHISPLISFRRSIAAILGPSLAGILITTLGASWVYAINIITYVLSLFFLTRIPSTPPIPTIHDKPLKEAWVEGVRYLQKRPDIVGSYATDFIAMSLANAVALYPALAALFHHSHQVGFLYATPFLGALTMNLLSRWTTHTTQYGKFIVIAAVLWGVVMSTIGVLSNFHFVLLALFSAGFFNAISAVFRMNLWNKTIPESIRGRLASFEILSYMSGPLLGNMFLGFLAEGVGVQKAMLIGGALSVICVILFNLVFTSLWRVDIRHHHP